MPNFLDNRDFSDFMRRLDKGGTGQRDLGIKIDLCKLLISLIWTKMDLLAKLFMSILDR